MDCWSEEQVREWQRLAKKQLVVVVVLEQASDESCWVNLRCEHLWSGRMQWSHGYRLCYYY